MISYIYVNNYEVARNVASLRNESYQSEQNLFQFPVSLHELDALTYFTMSLQKPV